MIAVDTNVLVYAHREDSPWHQPAVAALTRLAEGSAPWAIPWPCVHEFLAVVTHPKIYRPPTPLALALAAVQAWLDSPTVRLLGEGLDHMKRLSRLAVPAKASGPLIHDAKIVAVCLSHGVRVLWSADRDFTRFPELKTHNPLIGQSTAR